MSGAPMPSSFDDNSEFYEENRWQKFSRRLKEEPLIPLGCALTCYALLGATRSIRAGDHARTNRMFRARIYAQGFTLAALVAGSMYYQTDRDKRKQFDKVVTEKKAQEKNQAWIRELEARDEEEKLARGRREAAREAAASVSRANCMVEKSERRGEGVLRAVRELWRR
ncbi:MAG: Respiratory supercomplex factor 1, mitochondrial [Thelocarpon impressellum]|nr:MAG: Respiratory supercomplex factor 1, mitochondrial [Thelocarpon impressellum]